jgi:hypothetical protein
VNHPAAAVLSHDHTSYLQDVNEVEDHSPLRPKMDVQIPKPHIWRCFTKDERASVKGGTIICQDMTVRCSIA